MLILCPVVRLFPPNVVGCTLDVAMDTIDKLLVGNDPPMMLPRLIITESVRDYA